MEAVKRDFHIKATNYTIGKRIGKGGFGRVYAGVRKQDNLPVAIKLMKIKYIQKWGQLQDGTKIPMEIYYLACVQHIPGVIKLYKHLYVSDTYYAIIMERDVNSVDVLTYSDRCELAPEQQYGHIPEHDARTIFKQLIQTVIACHEAHVLHCDLKDQNILVNTNTKQIKLLDFGCSTRYHTEQYTVYRGTKLYAPPEWFVHAHFYGESATVWTLGVILYGMIFGAFPFETERQIVEGRLCIPKMLKVSSECIHTIKNCLSYNPEDRPTLKALLNHPFFV